MATDYTVIQPVRQRFGDDPSGAIGSKSDWDEFPAEPTRRSSASPSNFHSSASRSIRLSPG